MARTLPEFVWQSRRELIARQSQSGKSVTEFCQEHRLSMATFYAWKKRTQSDRVVTTALANPRDAHVSSRRGQSPAKGEVAIPPFLQLPLVSVPEPNGPPWVELTLPSGAVVRVPAQQLAALELVLKLCQPFTRRPSMSEGGNHV